MSKTASFLYNLARMANDVEKIKRGDSKKIVRRVKNNVIGRKIIKKVWRLPF